MRVSKTFERRLSNTFWSIVLTAVSIQIPHWYQHFNNRFNKSGQRAAFETKNSIQVNGDTGDRAHILSELSDIVERENGAYIGAINFVSTNPLERDLMDLALSSRGAYMNPFCASVNIVSDTPGKIRQLVFSSVKRAKIEQLVEEQPDFLEKWDRTYLMPRPKGKFTWFGSELDSLRDVYISQAAEIAAVSEMYSESPENAYVELFGREVNPDLRLKIHTLQDYGLIPKEYLEYVSLSGMQQYALRERDKQSVQAYLNASSRFLKENPMTIYAGNIRFSRAVLLEHNTGLFPGQEAMLANELKLGLRARYKERNVYLLNLNAMVRHYKREGDKDSEKTMIDSTRLHLKRYFDGDLDLHTRGVNDYLVQAGIL